MDCVQKGGDQKKSQTDAPPVKNDSSLRGYDVKIYPKVQGHIFTHEKASNTMKYTEMH